MACRLVIFDFDGTLADSMPFFLGVFNQVADRHGFQRIDPADAPRFRHQNARQLMQLVGLPAWKLPQVTASFIALMRQGAGQIPLFPGIPEVLNQLAQAGLKLAIVTSNSQDNVERILGRENMALIKHIESGMSIFGKTGRLRRTLKLTDTSPAEAIYIGDQSTDLEAARPLGLAFGAVTWGYGSIESLRPFRPDREFDKVSDLSELAPRGRANRP
jgi:phosphoglycolate phosphatase